MGSTGTTTHPLPATARPYTLAHEHRSAHPHFHYKSSDQVNKPVRQWHGVQTTLTKPPHLCNSTRSLTGVTSTRRPHNTYQGRRLLKAVTITHPNQVLEAVVAVAVVDEAGGHVDTVHDTTRRPGRHQAGLAIADLQHDLQDTADAQPTRSRHYLHAGHYYMCRGCSAQRRQQQQQPDCDGCVQRRPRGFAITVTGKAMEMQPMGRGRVEPSSATFDMRCLCCDVFAAALPLKPACDDGARKPSTEKKQYSLVRHN